MILWNNQTFQYNDLHLYMVSLRPRTPPQHLWLIFDFTVLSIQEIKEVYLLIKDDSDMKEDILELDRCYKFKKAELSSNVYMDPTVRTAEMVKEGYVPLKYRRRVEPNTKIPIMKKCPRKGIEKERESSNGKNENKKHGWWPFKN